MERKWLHFFALPQSHRAESDENDPIAVRHHVSESERPTNHQAKKSGAGDPEEVFFFHFFEAYANAEIHFLGGFVKRSLVHKIAPRKMKSAQKTSDLMIDFRGRSNISIFLKKSEKKKNFP